MIYKPKFMTNKKIVAGILTGVAAGVVISMILSTKKGRETSGKLLKRGNNLKEDLKGKFSEFVDQVQGKLQGILK
jgi:gas vesicle protein